MALNCPEGQLARTAGARGTRGLTLTQSSRTTVTVQMMGILTREKSLTYLQWPRVATVSPVQATAIATKGSSARLLGSDGKYCLRPCEDHKDCLSGYQCYQASSCLKACVPNTYNCAACALTRHVAKACAATSPVVSARNAVRGDPCTYDYDCAGNMRCFKKAGNPTGACVEECEKDNCSDPATSMPTQPPRC